MRRWTDDTSRQPNVHRVSNIPDPRAEQITAMVFASRSKSADGTPRTRHIGEHRQHIHEGLGIRRNTLKPDSVTFNKMQNGIPFRYPRSSSRKCDRR